MGYMARYAMKSAVQTGGVGPHSPRAARTNDDPTGQDHRSRPSPLGLYHGGVIHWVGLSLRPRPPLDKDAVSLPGGLPRAGVGGGGRKGVRRNAKGAAPFANPPGKASRHADHRSRAYESGADGEPEAKQSSRERPAKNRRAGDTVDASPPACDA